MVLFGLSPTVTIDELLDYPIVNTSWKAQTVDPEMVRFGLIWKLYDLVRSKGFDYKVPILTVHPHSLIGGVDQYGSVTGK